MQNRLNIDRRILLAFMMMMFGMNFYAFLLRWQWMMEGNNDFPPFYASAQMLREGQASRLYDFEAENRFLQRTGGLVRPPNNHLPYENLIFVPFTYLHFGPAHILWTLLSAVMLVAVALLMRALPPGKSSFSPTLVTVLAFFPVWNCVSQGQDSILLVFLFAISFWFWRRQQDDAAGFVLALGLFRPQLVLPFVFITFLSGKWRFVRGFIPGAVFVIGLSTCVVGFRGMADYARILISQGTQGSASTLAQQWHVWPQLMPTLRGLLWITIPSWGAGKIESLLLLCGTFGALLWAAKRMRNAKDAAGFDLAFATAVAVVVLVSFHSYLHDFSLMILPLLISGNLLASSLRVTKRSAYLIVTLGLLFFGTLTYLFLDVTNSVGLLALPVILTLWLMGRWKTECSLVLAPTQQASLRSLRTL
jgi:hypothetical protein